MLWSMRVLEDSDFRLQILLLAEVHRQLEIFVTHPEPLLAGRSRDRRAAAFLGCGGCFARLLLGAIDSRAVLFFKWLFYLRK